MRAHKLVVGVTAVALIVVVSAAPADACHGSDEVAESVGCFTTLYFAAAALTLGVVEVVYASDPAGPSRRWLWAQILGGGLPVTLGGIATIASLATGNAKVEVISVWGTGLALAGGLLALQGIVRLRRRSRLDASHSRSGLDSLAVALGPTSGGALGSLRLRF